MIYVTPLILAIMSGILISGFRASRRSGLADPGDRALWSNPRSFTLLELALLLQSAVGTLAGLIICSSFISDPPALLDTIRLGSIAVVGLLCIPLFRKLRSRL